MSEHGTKRKFDDSTSSQYSEGSEGASIKRVRRSPSLSNDQPSSQGSQSQPIDAAESQGSSQETVVETPHYTHDFIFYFDDGDVYVILDSLLFRVHRKKLVEQGGVFEDLLGSPVNHPNVAENPYGDGIPTIHLSLDLLSVLEFQLFLKNLYGTLVLHSQLPDGRNRLHWPNTLSIMRACDKLSLSRLPRSVIDALECLFPTSGRPSSYKPVIAGVSGSDEKVAFCQTFPFDSIRYFHRFDLLNMLPMAYYHASQLGLKYIFDGHRRTGGTDQDIQRIIMGRDELIKSRKAHFQWLSHKVLYVATGFERCKGPRNEGDIDCGELLLELDDRFRRIRFIDDRCDPLEGMTSDGRSVLESTLCKPCWREARSCMDTNLEKVWRKLPEYFGLGTWTDLQQRQLMADVDV